MSSSRQGPDNRKVTLKMIGAALAVSMLMVGAIAWSRPASAAQAEAPRASAMGGTAANVLGDSRFDATAPAAGGSDEVPRDARSCAMSGHQPSFFDRGSAAVGRSDGEREKSHY